MESDPQYGNAYNNRGCVYLDIKKYDKAFDSFNRSLQLSPDDSCTLYDIAYFYSLQKKNVESLTYLKKAIEKGYKIFEHMETDTDLDNIRDDDQYKLLLAKFKEKPEE